MKKADLIAALGTKENLTEKQATDIINQIFKGFTDTLKKGDKIEIRGFGSFTMRQYEAYTGRNPRMGINVDVGQKRLPFFRVGRELKETVDLKK
jgi:integration host factor subunit beta